MGPSESFCPEIAFPESIENFVTVRAYVERVELIYPAECNQEILKSLMDHGFKLCGGSQFYTDEAMWPSVDITRMVVTAERRIRQLS